MRNVMKTAFRLICAVLAVLLLLTSCSPEPGTEEQTDILSNMIAANRPEAILSRHRSVRMETQYEGSFDSIIYMDGERSVSYTPQSRDVVIALEPGVVYACSGGQYIRCVFFDPDAPFWLILTEGTRSETIQSVEQSEQELIVRTRLSKNDEAAMLERYFPQGTAAGEVESITTYVLDPKTYEIRSSSGAFVFPDGREEQFAQVTLVYDEDPICTAETEAMKEHLSSAEKTHTATFRFANGKREGQEIVVEMPVGDGVWYTESLYATTEYAIDREKSTLFDPDLTTDAVFVLATEGDEL